MYAGGAKEKKNSKSVNPLDANDRDVVKGRGKKDRRKKDCKKSKDSKERLPKGGRSPRCGNFRLLHAREGGKLGFFKEEGGHQKKTRGGGKKTAESSFPERKGKRPVWGGGGERKLPLGRRSVVSN